MCILLHDKRVGISGNIIYFLTRFVQIPARNSVNHVIPRLECMDFEIISQECSLGDPLPILHKSSSSFNKMVARAKKRKKTFKCLLLLNQ